MLSKSRFHGVVLERLRERFAKPYVVGSTPTHASNSNSPEMFHCYIFLPERYKAKMRNQERSSAACSLRFALIFSNTVIN